MIDEPRELSVYDSLAYVDIFGKDVNGQPGITLRFLAAEIRKLNKVIHERKVSDAAIPASQRSTGEFSAEFDSKPPYLHGETD